MGADAEHRGRLPQLDGGTFLTDGGIETTLIFHEGLELPLFAAVDLLRSEDGTNALRGYFRRYARIAEESGTGLVLESPTWRASPGWAQQLGYSDDELAGLNRKAIELMVEIRDEFADAVSPIVISGCLGPEGDGYDPAEQLSAEAARDYHSTQIATFAETAADMVAAITMTYPAEAIGIALAAREAGMPVAISFTVETDGALPSGHSLEEGIDAVERATDGSPAYYMINCAHPTHFEHVLGGEEWTKKIRGLRANASTMSHAELDEATELDAGDPPDLARRYAALRERLPNLNVVGGCCGTDERHVTEIAAAFPR
jgi:S-methylmethionine-dependent homocysteine/selenocysteine methylase